jgi:hypothetical protein
MNNPILDDPTNECYINEDSCRKEIFVFGSNLGGFHGSGSAAAANAEHGAPYGLGVGPWGNSYAIPTKDSNIEVLPRKVVQLYCEQFVLYALEHPELTFNIVDIGCGLAGFRPEQIAPYFMDAPPNCNFLGKFKEVIEKRKALKSTEELNDNE